MSVKTLTSVELYPFKGLWHGITISHFMKYLDQGYLDARTSHRHWEGGQSFNENHPNYRTSHYVKGWSFTRERNYAFTWRDITILFDADLIRRDFKMMPISWSARRNPKNNNKIEMEEFIVSNYISKNETEIQEEYSNKLHSLSGDDRRRFLQEYPDWFDYLDSKGLKTIDIQKYVKGFFISNDIVDIYPDEVSELCKHPLFKGFYDIDSVLDSHNYKSFCYIKSCI